jgi:hypothetical protein
MPWLLSGLGSPGPRVVGAVAESVTAISSYRWGACVRAVPIDGGHQLGRPREGSTAPRGQTRSLLLEGDVKEPPCLMQPLIGLQVQHVRDVLQTASSGHHVVGRASAAQHVGSPYVGIGH